MSPPANRSETTPPGSGLHFELARRQLTIPLEAIRGLVPRGRIHPVPGAPEEILGLAEWRGRLLTVVDLPRLLGAGAPSNGEVLLRLAPPLEDTALLVPAAVSLVQCPDGSRSEMLDPFRLVRELEARLREISAVTAAGG